LDDVMAFITTTRAAPPLFFSPPAATKPTKP
jgi:hypothetical protein